LAALQAEVEVVAVVVPAERPGLAGLPRQLEAPRPDPLLLPLVPEQQPHTIMDIAWTAGIPVWEVGKLTEPETLAMLAAYQPDLIVVACFSRIFPRALLQLPQAGCLNLHPSLLPAYRGPMPLFWIFRQGETRTGVTLHFLDEGLDSGPIVSQTAFDLPDGMSEFALNQRCAAAGAKLLTTALGQLEIDSLPAQPQPTTGSSYFPSPSAADFRIPLSWPARRAFNFMRGANMFPLIVDAGETQIRVIEALSYDPELTLTQPYQIEPESETITIQFAPGILKIRGILSTASQGRSAQD
jgi:methionyl-tRNA formyltransferase